MSMTIETATVTPVAVTTTGRPVGVVDPLSAYLRLSDRFGRQDVYLLESVSGPAVDTRDSFIGFQELMRISVTRGTVEVSGLPTLVEAVRRRTGMLLRGSGSQLVLGDSRSLWDVLRAVHACFDAPGSATGFSFGFLAFFGYDTAHYIEELPLTIEPVSDLPDVSLVLYQGLIRVDPDGAGELITHHSDGWPQLSHDELTALATAVEPAPAALPASVSTESTDSTTAERYFDSVQACLEHIAAGDIYQVQIGHEVTMLSPADPVDTYRRLRERNPSPYMYLAPLAGRTIIGASPELFARIEDGLVTMRPIAGTLPCDQPGVTQQQAARQLREDPKEIAEHIMLVDLCRNDIGRICVPGTLDVPHMLVAERFNHLLHLVSTVVGQTAVGLDGYDVIAALFPSGTMTGAPKIRAMEIIEAMETSRRGIYAGALGLIDIGGYVNLALCIRTLVHQDGVYQARASAGVVADSTPQQEWNETLAKLGAARWAVTGEDPR